MSTGKVQTGVRQKAQTQSKKGIVKVLVKTKVEPGTKPNLVVDRNRYVSIGKG